MAKKINTFLDFLQQDKFYKKIKTEVLNFFEDNKELILNKLHDHVNRIFEIDECDLDYKNVWIDSKEGGRIDFDIAISIELSVIASYGGNHDRDTYNASYIWVTVFCSGDISKYLEDFEIIGVEEYNKSKPKKPLSGDLVPIIYGHEYNKYANEILAKHYSEVLETPMRVDADELAKRMGLNVVNKSITEDGSLFGQIYFKDTKADLYDKKTKAMKRYNVPANTIIVDKEVAYLYSFGSRSMTIAHECIHYALHKKAFHFAQMVDKDLKYIQCQVQGRIETADAKSNTYWMELQANSIAPYLLMPEKTFEMKVDELYKSYGYFKDRDILDFIEWIIKNLAEFFDVTIYAAKRRMIDLGYEVANGAYNWIDGKYTRPYRFAKGALDTDETFTISYEDVLDVLFSNESIVAGLIYQNYIFVENHVCLNDDKYITKDIFGNLVLSDYARTHIDECCLKFTIKTVGFSQSSFITTFCYLGRDCRQNFKFELNVYEEGNIDVISKAKHKQNADEYRNGIKEMMAINSMTLAEAIKFLMELFDTSSKKLEINSGIDERTIRRYASGESTPSKRKLIAVCRGMKLPYSISELLLSRAGMTLILGDSDDEFYKFVLIGKLDHSFEEVDDFLIKSGCKPLIK